nr:hypothetical protein [Tanacetum cinerariifolium]
KTKKAQQIEKANLAWDDVQAKIEAEFEFDFKQENKNN